ncbi:hypothetical protein [Paenibacillus sedimenti]|uniref:hypothetical protein n=1 Tax=Paenibacillus sedimenti TaxID=2770274 RepID=UPI001CB6D180|nr:hypothetical protein [Paenibacillus sedimenti]
MTTQANQQTPQQPLHTEYGPRTTAEEIILGVDLAGKVAIVIGVYFRYWLGGIEGISQGRRPSDRSGPLTRQSHRRIGLRS